MDEAAYAHLHRATLRILHSHSFTSSSSVASHTLTSLFASYLDLLARSCVARAQHAGRIGVGWGDVVGAMDEVGVGLDEMGVWCKTEAGEVGKKYVVGAKEREYGAAAAGEKERAKVKGRGVLGVSSWHANGVGVSVGPGVEEARRKELVDVDEYVSEGLVKDPSSAVHLVYARLPPSPVTSDDEDEEDESRPYDIYTSDSKPPDRGAPPVALPLSPVSNKSRSLSPGSPNSKRVRTQSWTSSPPDHIPDFLPPFPSLTTPPTQSSPTRTIKLRHKSVGLPTPDGSDTSTSTGAIPYARSALANLPASLLPPTSAPSALPPLNANPTLGTVAAPSIALREAFAQYTNSPTSPFPFPTTISASGPGSGPGGQASGGANPARSRAARVLASALGQAFDASDSLFGAWGGVEARGAPTGGEGVPVLVDAQGELMIGKKAQDKASALAVSGAGGKVLSREEDVQSAMGYFNSPLLPLARAFLAPGVLHKTTRIIPPQPLQNNSNMELMYYHLERAIPAPWSVHVSEADGGPIKELADGKGSAGDGLLPDAKLVPTWDWPEKSSEAQLNIRRGRGIVGGGPVGNQGRAGSVAGA